MGLDVVELILAIEESFDISISDQEAGELATVGDIHGLVLSKLQIQGLNKCLTSAAFYRTRRALVGTLGVTRREIRPTTSLHQILPRGTRRQLWQGLGNQMDLKLPSLRYPDHVLWGLLTLGVALPTACGLHLRWDGTVLALTALAGVLLGVLLIKAASPCAIKFPAGSLTVGDLSKAVLALNYAKLARDAGSTRYADVWEALRRLIHEQTSVPLKKITPAARIVDDLRLD